MKKKEKRGVVSVKSRPDVNLHRLRKGTTSYAEGRQKKKREKEERKKIKIRKNGRKIKRERLSMCALTRISLIAPRI